MLIDSTPLPKPTAVPAGSHRGYDCSHSSMFAFPLELEDTDDLRTGKLRQLSVMKSTWTAVPVAVEAAAGIEEKKAFSIRHNSFDGTVDEDVRVKAPANRRTPGTVLIWLV